MSAMNDRRNKKRPEPNWLRNIPPQDRLTVDAVAKWLRPVAWQWFITLTFPWNVRQETAVRKLRQFINQLEKFCGVNVCCVAGQESKPRQHGMNVPTHFHLLLTSYARISREAIEAIWLGQVANRPSQGRNGESVQVEPYNSHERGVEYCLKSLNEASGDWLIHRLEHFLPGAPGSSKPNHRSVRNARRNREQATRFASAP